MRRLTLRVLLATAALILTALPLPGQKARGSAYITLRLPQSVSMAMPRNWRVLTEDARLTVDAAREALLSEIDLESLPSHVPFAANYYDGAKVTAGILNIRYYPGQALTQRDVRHLTASDIRVIDGALRSEIIRGAAAAMVKIVEWRGTALRSINGRHFLVTEYRRTSASGKTFRVRLVRMLAGRESFTVTVSYREDEPILRPITDYMIATIRTDDR